MSASDVLERLGDALALTVPETVMQFSDRFGGALRHFCEIGVQLPNPALTLLTLGSSPGFAAALELYLREVGYGDAEIAKVLMLEEALGQWMMVRVLDRGRGAPEIGLYFRRSMPLDDGLDLLERLGVARSESGPLQGLARRLGSDRAGLISARLRPHRPMILAAYVHGEQPDDGVQGEGSLAGGLAETFDSVGVDDTHWRPFLKAMHTGPRRDIYVSLGLGDPTRPPAVKLDYFRLELKRLDEVVDAADIWRCSPKPSEIAAVAGVTGYCEHAGFRFRGPAAQFSFYIRPTHREMA